MSTYNGPAQIEHGDQVVAVHASLVVRHDPNGLGSWEGRVRVDDGGDLFDMLGADGVTIVVDGRHGDIIITNLPVGAGEAWATVRGSGPPPF